MPSNILDLNNLIEGGFEHFSDRFWSKAEIGNADECWEWQAAQHEYGYGVFRVGSKAKKTACNAKAHRVAWFLTFGSIPSGQFVLHHCDNPPCVNPQHLFIGNNADNQRDMKEKGRSNHDEKHWNCKLKNDDVIKIKTLLDQGTIMQKDIAVMFGVSKQTICDIKKGRRHAHIGSEQSYE